MTPFLLNSLPVRAFAAPELAAEGCVYSDRAIVLVYLGGGNDGINNLVPIDQYDLYANIRPNLRLPLQSLVSLDQQLDITQAVSLHPSMTPVKDIYEQGKLNIVQGVGYPFPNRSHFKSSDIMMTGGDGLDQNHSIQTGWMGRYLESYYNGFEEYLSQELPDPLGVILGGPSLGFHTHAQHSVEVELTNVGGFLQNVLSVNTGVALGTLPNNAYGDQLRHILQTENSLNKYAKKVDEVYRKGRNTESYPHARGLGYQLKMVARLLSGGSRTKIFITTLASFDTHANQVVQGDTVKGWHSSLLGDLSQALRAFQKDLHQLNVEDRVMTVVFSEFGRKITENANKGTDHGTLGPMYVMGSQVQAGMTGKNIRIDPELLNGGAPDVDKQLQYDYRQVFGTLLQDWLGARNEDLDQAKFMDYMTEKPALIATHSVVDPSSYGCQDLSYQTRVHFGELGRKRILQQREHQWHDVYFQQSYEDPVVVVSPVSYRGSQACTTRIQQIGDQQFQCKIHEWEYMDGRHVQEEICYWIMEAGVYHLEGENTIMAGNTLLNHQWLYIPFPTPFETEPVVLAHCNSVNDPRAVVIRIKHINTEGCWMCLQSEEGEGVHFTPENVGWIAVEPYIKYHGNRMEAGRSGTVVSSDWHHIHFNNQYAHTPYFFAGLQSFEEADPAHLRWNHLNKEGVEIFVQEETSLDKEIQHIAEDCGYVAIESALLTGQHNDSQHALQPTLRTNHGNNFAHIISETYQTHHQRVSTKKFDSSFLLQRSLHTSFYYHPEQSLSGYHETHVYGLIVPPVSGDYTFWIAGQQGATLLLSKKDDPETYLTLAEVPQSTRLNQWESSDQQVSSDVHLLSGNEYLLRVKYHFTGQNAGIAVGWKQPDGTVERPIHGQHFIPFVTQIKNHNLANLELDSSNVAHSSLSLHPYPNPFQDTLYLRVGNPINKRVKVELFDASGRIVLSQHHEIQKSPISIPIDQLSSGAYILRVDAGGKVVTKNLVKL